MSKLNLKTFKLDAQTTDVDFTDITGDIKLDPSKFDSEAVLAGNAATSADGHKLVKDSALHAEKSRALAAEAAVDAKVDQEIVDRTADVNTEKARALAAEAAIQADVDQNEADADASFSAASTDRAAIRTEMASDKAELKAEIDSDVAAQEVLAANARAAIQADVEQNEADADAAMAAEQTARADGDAAERAFALAARNANESARDASVEVIRAALQADIDGNEADADTAIAAVASDLSSYETSNDAALAAELVARAAGDAAVQADVDANEAAAATDRAAIRSELAAEVVALLGDVAAEYDTLGKMEDKLQVEQGRIDAILAAADADYDSFKEIVDLINSVDTENDNALAAAVLSINNSIAALQADVDGNESDGDTDRAAIRSEFATADAAIQADVDANEAAALAGRNTIASDLASYETSNDAALAAELVARAAGDASLQTEMDMVRGDKNTAGSFAKADKDLQDEYISLTDTLTADLLSEEGARIAGDAAATTDRAAIRSEFAAADTALVGGASDSYNTMKKIEDLIVALQADVDGNESDADAADAAEAAARNAADDALQASIDVVAGNLATEIADTNADFNAASAARAAIQADVDQNEADGDTDRAAIRAEMAQEISDLKGDAGVGYKTLGQLEDKIQAEEARLDSLMAGIGVDYDTLVEIVAAYQLADTSIVASITALQADVAANELASDNAEAALQSELDATQTGAGLGDGGAYVANASMKIIDTATSLKDADEKLESAIRDLQAGAKMMSVYGNGDDGALLSSEFTAFTVTADGTAFDMEAGDYLQRKVSNGGSKSIVINAAAGKTFMNGASSITLHPMQSAVIVTEGDKHYMF